MRRWRRQLLLALVAAICVLALIVVASERDLLRDEQRPEGVQALAARLASRPADWLTAAALTDAALDSGVPRRIELWRAAYAHARFIAPHRRNAAAGFVRAGLFHWYELGARDRRRVQEAAAPLLRERAFFQRMHVPLWQLTRDFAWLRRHAPDTDEARIWLRDLALSRGLFADYRALREELRASRLQTFAAVRHTADTTTLLSLLPERLERRYDPLVRGILEELERKPFDPAQIHERVETVVAYAVRHELGPLRGIRPLLETEGKLRPVTRARAALDLGDANIASRIEMVSATSDVAEWEPYYLDRARFEARRGDAAAAQAYLDRAATGGRTSIPLLAAARDVAAITGRDTAPHEARLARATPAWTNLCGNGEVCNSARAFVPTGRTWRLTVANVQSDETPPYVEVYVDDALVAEGEVRDTRAFEMALAPGVHEVEVRLVNTHTRNGVQRRVRLS